MRRISDLVLSDLERAVEELSELIEAPIDPETIMTLRQKVTDKTVSTALPPVRDS